MNDQVKVVPIKGHYDGLVDRPGDEAIEFARSHRQLLATFYGDQSPEVKGFDKILEIKHGGAVLREVQRSGDSTPYADPETGPTGLDKDPDPKDLKVQDDGGNFVGMSLRGSLDHLLRTGRCSQEEATRMSLEPARSVAVFLEARKAVPRGTYKDAAERADREAEATVDKFYGKVKV